MDRPSAARFARPIRGRNSIPLAIALGLLAGGGLVPWKGICQDAETPSVNLQYPNNPLMDILRDYEELTGMKIIKDVNVLGATVSVETTGMLTKAEAVRFIEKTLLLNGYAFVPSGDNTVKIISFGSGKQPRSEGIPIFSRVEDLPDTDQVVNFFMPLTYITTEEAVRTFTLVIPSHTYGVVVPVPNASAVIISENSAVIRSLVELKDHVDVPPAQVLNKSIQLERSDAEEVSGILMDLLGAQSESRTGGSAPRATQARAAQAGGAAGAQAAAAAAAAASAASAGGGGGASTSESIQPQIVPIVRTNRLLVIARPIDMTYIEGLIKEFDAPAEIRTFLKRRLSYFRVTDFLPIASDALLRGQETGIAGGAGALGRTTATRTTAAAGRQTGGAGAGGAGGLGGGGTAGGGGGFSGGLGVEAEEMGVAQSLVVGKTLLISDPQANMLIVSGPPENLRIVDELLDELDVRSNQIYLSTVIGEMTRNDQFDWSAQFARTYGGGPTEGGAFSAGGSGGRALVIDPVTVLSAIGGFGGLGAPPAGVFAAGKLDEFHLFISTLETDANFNVLSRPSIFVRNNAVATIRRGERRPVPSSTFTDTTGGQTSNVDYVDIVLELEVTALINSEDEVTLRIAQVNDNTTENVIIDDNEIPVISTQELTTEITVPNQSTVIIGGLISEEKRDDKSGVPFLVNLPVIGGLFGTTREQDLRRELLIFMQPHIINDVSDLVNANTDLTRRTDVAGDALDFALPEPPDVRQPALEGENVGDGAVLQQALEEEMRKRAREEEAEVPKKKGWGIFRKRDKGKTGPPTRR